MKASVLRTTVAALAASAVLLTAGCSAEESDAAETPAAEETAADQGGEVTGPVEVPDVTVLILETAEGNLERAGLQVEVVDASGAPVEDEDRTAWIVTDQDPAEGTLEAGETVTLVVEAR